MPKAILSFYAIFLAIALSSCNFSKGIKDKAPVKEFEGIITYKIEYTSWRDSDQAKPYIDTLKLYYSHGNIMKIRSGNGLMSAKKEIILLQNHQYYFKLVNKDTLFRFDITKSPGMELSEMHVNDYDKQILGHKCERVDLSIKHTRKGPAFFTENSFIFSRDYLQINRENIDWYKFAFFDKFIDESGCLYLGYKYALHSSIDNKVIESFNYEAISVKEQKIDPKIFEVDNLPLKDFKL
jgi:hypothetical protein